MYRKTQTEMIQRLSDNAFIPTDSANSDYQEYLKWLEAGNQPEPYIEPPKPIPSTVTMRQARIALHRAGVLSMIEAALQGNVEAQIEWEYATTVDRNSALVAELASSLGLTPEALDALFDQASQI